MQIDIRTTGESRVTEIIFGDCNQSELDCYKLTLDNELSKVYSDYDGGTYVFIDSKEDALNLIKALQKAIELGNWDE